MNNFEKICKMSQSGLKSYLTKRLNSQYNDVVSKDGFIYAKGTFPVMLVAHMDTVHQELVKQIVYTGKGNIIASPQGIGGDDRCGITMILEIIKDYKCSVLFTEDEEKGCVGANKFVDQYEMGHINVGPVNYIIELDRKGSKDAVFYDCDNPDFTDFILESEDWELDYGSFTDIVDIAPALGVAAVNFSCGYYNAHTTKEYVVLSEMYANIEKVKRLLERTTSDDIYEFMEAKRQKSYGGWPTDSYYDEGKTYYFCADHRGEIIETEVYAFSEAEAFGQFLLDYPDVCVNDIIDFLCED